MEFLSPDEHKRMMQQTTTGVVGGKRVNKEGAERLTLS